ncbi:hypothetical protein ACT6P6_22145 [Priestia endophytica]
MGNIKKAIKDITEDRRKEKCYLIYDDEGDFFVIYGSRWRVVKGGYLYDVLISFLKKKTGWLYPKKNIIRDQNSNPEEWKYLNTDINDKIINIDILFIDGEKKN